ncbi:acyl-CoA thioesterase domain-containing protein [Agromyces sp. SYSU T00194]|uniref:acyl-CoA thioesterase domain-containing protein n=1 Tax=Agromyces chitinivorans TaxID=3158560 RepID=UPI003396A1D8
MPVLSAPERRSAGEVAVEFDPAWSVRAMFGGAVAAVAVRAARLTLREPLALSDALFAFVAPTPPGEAIVRVSPHRNGRRFAGADVEVVSDGATTMRGMLAFAAGGERMPPADAAAQPALPGPVSVAFDGAAEWSALAGWLDAATAPAGADISRLTYATGPHAGTRSAPATPAGFTSAVRAIGAFASLPVDEWACIAADLVGPALVPLRRGPFAVATATLSLTMHANAPVGAWWWQHVSARCADGVARSELELRTASGALLARSQQSAVVLPAEPAELPRSITAFGSSGITS